METINHTDDPYYNNKSSKIRHFDHAIKSVFMDVLDQLL